MVVVVLMVVLVVVVVVVAVMVVVVVGAHLSGPTCVAPILGWEGGVELG